MGEASAEEDQQAVQIGNPIEEKKYLKNKAKYDAIENISRFAWKIALPAPSFYGQFDNLDDIDYILLTHAHIDHSGMLPKLYKDGFRGLIYSTRETANLCNIMLRDAAHIQESEAGWRSRKAERAGEPAVEPTYTTNDALAGAAENIGKLLGRKHYYFVPFRQDDPVKKPTSMVADFRMIPQALEAALEGKQIQPVLP